jgi:hypothetical protein
MAECYILQALDQFVGWILKKLNLDPKPEPTPKPEPVSEVTPKLEPVHEYIPIPDPDPTGPVGDYIDRNWNDGQVVELSMHRMLEEIDIQPFTKEKCMKLTNTCIYLLEYYALLSKRKDQLYLIKNRIKEHYPNLADKIDINGQFVNCSFWEGKKIFN